MKIDIVVPYVDETDQLWQKDFKKYQELEIKAGIQTLTNTQAFGAERTRDWGAFRYWFRAVEKNCPWVNKVFLIVARKSQIPAWLNRKNKKLKIVLHKDFIPEEFLPTFSTLVIETFYSRIPELSEYFIMCNDDFYFTSSIPENLFFKDGKVIQGFSGYRPKKWNNGNSDWSVIINNTSAFLEKYIIKKETNEFYHYSHLPDGRIKSYEEKFLETYHDEIYKAMSVSKFRHPKNYLTSSLFIDSMKYTGFGILNNDLYKNSAYIAINSKTKYSTLNDLQMICFNDTAAVDDFDRCQYRLNKFLYSKFPNQSSFEIDDIDKPIIIEKYEDNQTKADGRPNTYLYF